jgi:hypothetical protein
MRDSSPIYENEDQRTDALRSLLENALGITILTRVNADGWKPDGMYEAELRGSKIKVIVVILEHKSELGDGQ